MKAERILETCVYAKNLDAAEEFYSRVLGLVAFAREPGRHVFFRCGDGVFLVFNPEATVQPGHGVPIHGAVGPGHVAFAVEPDDLPRWRTQLQRKKVPVEREVTWPSGGQSIYFRDPGGNSVELATPNIWGREQ